jgi:hypothetical protein
MFTTDPGKRREFIDGLRQLADCLDANPRLPVPGTETKIFLAAKDAEEGGITEILGLSVELAAPFAENGGFYRTVRKFGPVAYTAVSQTRASLAQYRAYNSYYGSVTPDD